MYTDKELVQRLLRRAGKTYAQEAGIRLRNQPMPLFQLLVFCMLAANPVDAAIAAAAAHNLFACGLRTAHKVGDADRRTVLDALHGAGYRHHDDAAATALPQLADAVRADYNGDLRGLAERSGREIESARALLQQLPGIGSIGAGMFLREVQDVWPWVRSTFDKRLLDAARDLGLPSSASELGALSQGRNAELAAALTRYSSNADVRENLND